MPYSCRCGRDFTVQQGYAAHQRYCPLRSVGAEETPDFVADVGAEAPAPPTPPAAPPKAEQAKVPPFVAAVELPPEPPAAPPAAPPKAEQAKVPPFVAAVELPPEPPPPPPHNERPQYLQRMPQPDPDRFPGGGRPLDDWRPPVGWHHPTEPPPDDKDQAAGEEPVNSAGGGGPTNGPSSAPVNEGPPPGAVEVDLVGFIETTARACNLRPLEPADVVYLRQHIRITMGPGVGAWAALAAVLGPRLLEDERFMVHVQRFLGWIWDFIWRPADDEDAGEANRAASGDVIDIEPVVSATHQQPVKPEPARPSAPTNDDRELVNRWLSSLEPADQERAKMMALRRQLLVAREWADIEEAA